MGESWFIVLGLAACAGYSFWYSFNCWHKNRTVANMPASRLRSAAQGYVQLDGIGLLPPDSKNKSPLTGTPCTWWSFKVEQRDREGWSTIDSDTSSAPFLLDDGTGQCLVNPCGAEVIPRATSVWYGAEAWPRGRAPPEPSQPHRASFSLPRPGCRKEKEVCSFLKKRTKKLLLVMSRADGRLYFPP